MLRFMLLRRLKRSSVSRLSSTIARQSSGVATSTEKILTQDPVFNPASINEESNDLLHPFKDFELSETALRLLRKRGFKEFFPIQAATFDPIVEGFDVVGRAKTGTGKTISFALPVLERLRRSTQPMRNGRTARVLVMAPTRELAKQVSEEFMRSGPEFATTAIYGGSAYGPQEAALRRGIDVVIGTPGRIMDHIQRGNLDLSGLQTLIMDEADHMLDMGFAEDMEQILQKIMQAKQEAEHTHQTLLFSATIPPWVKNVSRKFLKANQKVIDLVGNDVQKVADSVKHFCIPCPSVDAKVDILRDAISKYAAQGRAICFVERKTEADTLEERLSKYLQVASLHGDISQQRRDQVIADFRSGKLNLLVATDVAARGIDIPAVSLVVQNEPTREHESFIHRSGRTGRAGLNGVNIVLYTQAEERKLRHLERETGVKFANAMVQPKDTIDLTLGNALKNIKRVDADAIKIIRDFVKERDEASALLSGDMKDLQDMLCASLAINCGIDGHRSGQQRSLLSGESGQTTWKIPNPWSSRQQGAYVSHRQLLDTVKAVLKVNYVSNVAAAAHEPSILFDLPSATRALDNVDAQVVTGDLPELVKSGHWERRSHGDRGYFGDRKRLGDRRSFGEHRQHGDRRSQGDGRNQYARRGTDVSRAYRGSADRRISSRHGESARMRY